MSLKNTVRSKFIAILFGARMRRFRRCCSEGARRIRGKPHVVHVFLQLDDPYSYLLGEYLPEFAACYNLELRLYLTQAIGEELRPYPDLQAEYAKQDCERLAGELGIPFLDKGSAPPVEFRRTLINVLSDSENSASFQDDLLEALRLYWRGDAAGAARRVAGVAASGQGDAMLARNQERLSSYGHYATATLFYAGEWYRGTDRLHYLGERLRELGLKRDGVSAAKLTSLQQITHMSLPVSPPAAARDLPPLEFFFSYRSPYSYLALQRGFDLADAFGLKLVVRPVLPMMMRGVPVPRTKLRYIAADAMREAERLELPFGKFADPLGVGVERCLAVHAYALSENKEREFMSNAAAAIWSQGIDLANDRGLRKVSARTGLFWPEVSAATKQDDWRKAAEENRELMMQIGCWGVPTFKLGDFVVWGQDRLWLLTRHIEEQCDSGDGILI